MYHCNTIFPQILNLVPRHEFETLAKQHHSDRSFRTASRWSQFVTLAMAQLAGRISLRDIVENVSAQAHRFYHLGSAKLSRSNLSRINEDKPYALYEALAEKLLNRCQGMAPGHKFRFKNPLYFLDASTIDHCLSVFPWENFRSTKGAIKLHVGLNHDGYLPEFVTIKGVFFVTRLKANAQYQVINRQPVLKNKGLTSDQTIRLTNIRSAKKCPNQLRRVGYRDVNTGRHYIFLTNNFKLAARTIADIYKTRWQVELFFKWIKQNLKIKSFIGTSKNAVMTQIWIAMCVYLLLAFIKFQSKMNKTMQQILRLLQLKLFEKRDLMALLRGDPHNLYHASHIQMSLL